MMRWIKVWIWIVLALVAGQSFGQTTDFLYEIPLLGVVKGWNEIEVPETVFHHTNDDLASVRIYAQSTEEATPVEQPYIPDMQNPTIEVREISFKTINSVHIGDQYFFTFELSNREEVNRIQLDFQNQNYDWKVKLEGSMNQGQWATIGTDYRIVSLQNQEIAFTYSTLNIPNSKYSFYRITLRSEVRPTLNKATISKVIRTQENYTRYPDFQKNKVEEAKSKSSVYHIDLKRRVPISRVSVVTKTDFDYYRPIRIEAVKDSFKTEKGWNYRYTSIYHGTINSLDGNRFDFKNKVAQKLKVTISNFDNPPLPTLNFTIEGPKYRLIARLEETENAVLKFGNPQMRRPRYDIAYFKDKIPKDLNQVRLGTIIFNPPTVEKTEPLIKSKWWIWVSMILIIMLLAYFTLNMVRENQGVT